VRRAALLILALALAACSRSTRPTPPPGVPSPLRAGISDNYPPLAFVDDGRLVGIEVDFAAELQKQLGVTVEIAQTPWDDLIPDLLAGRIDVIMSGMSITEERARDIAFTQPYLDVGQMLAIRRDQVGVLAAPGALAEGEWRVAVIADTTGAAWARGQLPRAIVVPYTSVDDAVNAVRRREADYFVHDAPTIWRLTADPAHVDEDLIGLYQPLTEEQLAWAVRPGDAALLRALDAALAEWRANGRLGEIQARWIRATVEVQ
jgi:ABC-type amino acid transport substrate-binding protein